MSNVKQYRKKPVVIEAIQYHAGMFYKEFDDFTGGKARQEDNTLVIDTLEGTMTAQFGDYIIKGVKNEFYPCKPDIFEATYELVSDPTAEEVET